MANNGIYYSSGNTLNFTTNNTTWATLTSGGTFQMSAVSATTYYNLPPATFTGGTVSGATNFTGGLTANTISATTYQNLPQDVFVTGGTYTAGSATFTNTTGGTFSVTGFPVGGGGGQIFYLNLSQSQGSNRLLSTTGSTASEQSTGVTINNGVTGTIASFQSQPLNTTLLPGGIWSFYLHSYKQNNNASFNIFVELYKITSGGTQTLLFSTDPTPVTTNSPNPSMQLTDGYFSGTPLSVSDSIVAVVRATNTGNQSHIITLVSEGSQHYSYVVSTIPTQQGLTCETLSGCSIIQTIQTNITNKFDKSGGTVTGGTVFQSGLTANTISATTYENLPVSAVTSGTGISASTSNGVVTITNTQVQGITGITAGSGISANTTDNVTTISTNISASSISNATTVGQNLITLPNPSAISYLRINADNTVASLTLSQLKTDLGLTQQVLSVGVTTALVNTFEDTGFSFPVTSGKYYRWKVVMSVGATNSSCFGVSGVTFNFMNYRFTCQNAATTVTIFGGVANDTGANAAFSSNGLVIGEGYINPSASGTFKLRFRSLTAGALTIRAGSSLSWEEVL